MEKKDTFISKRRAARETAFILIFTKSFFDDISMSQLLEAEQENTDGKFDKYTVSLLYCYEKHTIQVDELIRKYSVGWNFSRLSRVVLALLRVSVTEIAYRSDKVPVSASINEAVELAKVYGGADDPAFINGILGSLVRNEKFGEESCSHSE